MILYDTKSAYFSRVKFFVRSFPAILKNIPSLEILATKLGTKNEPRSTVFRI